MSELTENQVVQEEQYSFPYHYADLISDKHKYFKFIEMLDLHRLVKDKVYSLNRKMILDAGCGDGRLCYELKGGDFTIKGIDYSARAIAFARAFNPEVEFYVKDLFNLEISEKFDVIILMEVLEHFIPDQVTAILASLAGVLKSDGKLLITVPSKNMKLSAKHYQHFDPNTLAETLKPHFIIEELTGYYRKGITRKLFNMMRSMGNIFYPFRKDLPLAKKYFGFYRKYFERNVSTGKPAECLGLMAVCKKQTGS